MLQVKNLSKEFAARVLFQNLSFTVGPNEKVGLVGRNGAGKSTLLKMIHGQVLLDQGEVQIPKDYRVGYLEQFIHFTKETLIEECMQVLKKEEREQTYRAERILSGLGFSPENFNQNPMSFSGGMQLRINLCKCLLGEPDLLLLDEPTNYLDIQGIRWLKNFLKRYTGSVLLITHDRSFMDDVVTHVLGLHRGRIYKVKGNSKKYYHYIEEQDTIHENTRLNQEKKRKETLEFVDKFRAKARQASLAQSRLKMLDKMEEIAVLPRIPLMKFRFNQKDFNAKNMITVKDLTFGYEDEPLFQSLNFSVDKRDRVAIMGGNGKGKSTLLRLLAKELNPNEGEVRTHSNNTLGFFGQTNLERLHQENTIAEEIAEVHSGLSDQSVRSICGSMLFSGDDAFKKIKVLSGGEKSRVMLGKIIATPCNLLFLDEPTNHFDQESVEVLIEELKDFKGALVFVTHSEYFARALATKMVVFNKGNCFPYSGDYDSFLEKHGWEEPEKVATTKPKRSHKDQKKMRADIIQERSKKLRPLKKKYQELEESINELDMRLLESKEGLITASEQGDGEAIVKLSKEVNILEKNIEESFQKLEEIDLEIESWSDRYQRELDQI